MNRLFICAAKRHGAISGESHHFLESVLNKWFHTCTEALCESVLPGMNGSWGLCLPKNTIRKASTSTAFWTLFWTNSIFMFWKTNLVFALTYACSSVFSPRLQVDRAPYLKTAGGFESRLSSISRSLATQKYLFLKMSLDNNASRTRSPNRRKSDCEWSGVNFE